MFAKVRQRLAERWVILAMLLAITLLADLVKDRLGFHALLSDAARVWVDITRVLIWLQRVAIFLAFLCGLLGWRGALRRLSIVTIGLVTIGLASMVAALIATFPRQAQGNASVLLTDGFVLWLMNVLVFTAWYWLIHTGGHFRADPPDGDRRDLLFPQQASNLPEWQDWRPDPLDYMFVAFSTSTAFSPTDTVFLTKRAKLLMMSQASTSLLIVTVILARAINAIQ